jgi:hypothetical protein
MFVKLVTKRVLKVGSYKHIAKILSWSWNKFHIQQESIEYPLFIKHVLSCQKLKFNWLRKIWKKPIIFPSEDKKPFPPGWYYYAPAMKWLGAYSVTHFLISVIIGFRSLSLEWLHTFNSNLVYEYIIGLCRFGHGLMILWQNYPSWKNFQFLLSNFCLYVCIRFKLYL